MHRVFLHIHIWKTAGTTFLNICRRNFTNSFQRDNMLYQHWFLQPDQIRLMLKYHDWLRCYSCHMLSGNLPYDMKSRELIGIAFIRDPVDRLISSFNFQIGNNYRSKFFKQTDFETYYKDSKNLPYWANGQTYILGGAADKSSLKLIEDRIKAGRLILFRTDRFDESCILLEKLFPSEFTDCSYTPFNVSTNKIIASPSQREEISEFMDLDYKLLKISSKYIDHQIDKLFPDGIEKQEYFKNFEKRCLNRKKKQRILSKVKIVEKYLKKHILNRIYSIIR